MTQLAGGSLSESDQGTPGYRMGAQGITGPTHKTQVLLLRRAPALFLQAYVLGIDFHCLWSLCGSLVVFSRGLSLLLVGVYQALRGI